jgi:hypothetical protein
MTCSSTNWIYSSIKYDVNFIGLPINLEPILHGHCYNPFRLIALNPSLIMDRWFLILLLFAPHLSLFSIESYISLQTELVAVLKQFVSI